MIMDYEDYMFNPNLDRIIYHLEQLKEKTVNINSNNEADSFLYLAHQINEGIKGNRLSLHFQPIHNIINKQIVGVETLIRLKNAKGCFISPSSFIPVAECTDQILYLEQYVFKTVLKYKESWDHLSLNNLNLSINLSAKTLMNSYYFDKLLGTIYSYDINFNKIIIELTETSIITDSELVRRNLKKLKEIGIKIALDDFGTGFSSLTHIQKLPIDIIKLDRSIINSIPDDRITCSIIKSIITLSQDLGIQIIAEGIENTQQLDYLICGGCTYGQGFLFSKPMPKEHLMNLFR